MHCNHQVSLIVLRWTITKAFGVTVDGIDENNRGTDPKTLVVEAMQGEPGRAGIAGLMSFETIMVENWTDQRIDFAIEAMLSPKEHSIETTRL